MTEAVFEAVGGGTQLVSPLKAEMHEHGVELSLVLSCVLIGLPAAIALEFGKFTIMHVDMSALALRSESTFRAGLAGGADRIALSAGEQLRHGRGAARIVPAVNGLCVRIERPGDWVFDSTMHERSAGMIND
jgi:hypothetical protein